MAQAMRVIEGVELPPAGTYGFDKAHTTIGFVARHMLSKVRGRFTDFDGEVVIGDTPEDSSVKVTIGAASVATDDERRDGHLRSDDFFQVETYPTLAFESTGVRPTGGSAFELDGNLTIKDVTRPVTLQAEFSGWGPGMNGTPMAVFSAKTTVDRTEWDLTWNVAVETGGLLVGKNVDLEIETELLLKQD
jgi:polyisoprenoid-binding protein YceI